MQVFALSAPDHWSQQEHSSIIRHRQNLVHHLADGLGRKGFVVIRTVGFPHPGLELPQVVVGLGNAVFPIALVIADFSFQKQHYVQSLNESLNRTIFFRSTVEHNEDHRYDLRMTERMIEDAVRFRLLRLLHQRPDISQREIAKELGLSLGKVNYCLKALIEVGHIKAGNFSRSQHKLGYMYLLTPKGIVEKTEVAARFLARKRAEYDALKQEIEELRLEVQENKQA